MAYEIFDDVAFYFLMQILLGVFLVPITVYQLYSSFSAQRENRNLKLDCDCNMCVKKAAMLNKNETSWKPYFTPKYVMFAILWVGFLYLLVQLPSFKNEELASFNPYNILELEIGADRSEITKSYRRLAKKYHPDRNREDPEANSKFLLVAKAHETLTDDAKRENYEKYGNPEGMKGGDVKGGIGLPSILTYKENEVSILMLYFLFFIVLPPICVFVWWKRASMYSESGLRLDSQGMYWRYMTTDMNWKKQIELLAVSAEYQCLERAGDNTDQESLTKMFKLLQDYTSKSKWLQRKYVMKAYLLIHAHLLLEKIPKDLHADRDIVLKEAYKLLNGMIEMALARNYFVAAQHNITLMQLFTQGLFNKDSSLEQLPHITDTELKRLGKNKIKSLKQFMEADPDKIKKILNAAPEKKNTGDESKSGTRTIVVKPESTRKQALLTDQEFQRVTNVVSMMPKVAHSFWYGVNGERGVHKGDVCELIVNLRRILPGEQEAVIQAELDRKAIEQGEENCPDPNKEDSRSFEEIITDLPLVKEVPPITTAPLVHSLHYPFPKRERWFVFLIDNRKAVPLVVDFKRLPDFQMEKKVVMHFPAPDVGKHNYEIQLRCDSYVGRDYMVPFKVEVTEPAEEAHLIEDEMPWAEGEEDEEDDLDDEDPPVYWYYLWGSSIWEGLLNLVLLGVLGFFFVNFLQTRGYWARYVTPFVNRAILPVWKKVHPVIAPVFDPLAATVLQLAERLGEALTAVEVPPRDDL